LDDLLLGSDIDPATLAAQVAAVDDRHVKERREVCPSFQTAFVSLDGQHAFPAHVPGQLPEQALIGFEQQALGHLQEHGSLSVRSGCVGGALSNVQTAVVRLDRKKQTRRCVGQYFLDSSGLRTGNMLLGKKAVPRASSSPS